MKKGEQALVPDFFQPAVKEATKIIKKPSEGQDNVLADLGDSDAWEALKGIVEGVIASLDLHTKKSVGKAKTMEEVGLRYLIRDISVDSMQSVLNIVELRVNARNAEKSAGK